MILIKFIYHKNIKTHYNENIMVHYFTIVYGTFLN